MFRYVQWISECLANNPAACNQNAVVVVHHINSNADCHAPQKGQFHLCCYTGDAVVENAVHQLHRREERLLFPIQLVILESCIASRFFVAYFDLGLRELEQVCRASRVRPKCEMT